MTAEAFCKLINIKAEIHQKPASNLCIEQTFIITQPFFICNVWFILYKSVIFIL